MKGIPYSHLEPGTFLIASPDVEGGIFFRGVVLLCEHSPSGSFGLMINKTLDLELPDEIINTGEQINPHIKMRAGGPVQTNQLMILHTSDQLADQSLQVCEGVYLGGDLQFLQSAIADKAGPDLLLCFGYAGWGAGQLEREYLDGGWFLCPASKHNAFDVLPEKLWQTLLREMGGKFATLSVIPEDVTLN